MILFPAQINPISSFAWFVRLLFIDANLHKQISYDVREETKKKKKEWTQRNKNESPSMEGVRLSAV